MNVTEFAALKVGDKIVNPIAGDGHGEVTAVAKDGVRVSWGGSARDFTYSVNTTAWMHWDKVEIVVIDPLSEHLADDAAARQRRGLPPFEKPPLVEGK